MRHWTYSEWVAYGAMFVAALIIAADTAFKTNPDLMAHLPTAFIQSAIWGPAAGVLVILATAILCRVISSFIIKRHRPHSPAGDFRQNRCAYLILSCRTPEQKFPGFFLPTFRIKTGRQSNTCAILWTRWRAPE